MASEKYNLRIEDAMKAWNLFFKEQGNKGFFTLLKQSEVAAFSASMKTCKAEVWYVNGKFKKLILTAQVKAVLKNSDVEEIMWQNIGIQLINQLFKTTTHDNFSLIINGTYNGEDLWKQQ